MSGERLFTVHGRDCVPCDAARAVVEALAVHWDPNDQWADVELDGVSVQRHAEATVAEVLHDHLPATVPRRKPR
jgi:hypothetical protein